MAGYYGKMEAENSLETEVWSIYQGLKLFVGKGFNNLSVETVSMEAKDLVKDGGATNHPLAITINEAHMLLTSSGSTIAHVGRNANQCADHLAHLSAEQEDEMVVTFNYPISIREYLLRDKLELVDIID